MKLTSALALLAVIGFTAAQAGHSGEELFRANETSIDAFGSVSIGQETIDHISGSRVRKDGRLGAGLGINHFFTRHLGIGADAYSENTNHKFVDNASASLIFRIPLDSVHLAPYAFGGGGYQFETADRAFLHAGAGLDVRLTKDIGLFADARYVFTRDAANFGQGRAGVRFLF